MKHVLKYYQNYIPLIFLVACFLFGQAMCELALPGYMSDIINNGIVRGDLAYVKSMGMIMIAVSAGSMLCAIGGNRMSLWCEAVSFSRLAGRLPSREKTLDGGGRLL